MAAYLADVDEYFSLVDAGREGTINKEDMETVASTEDGRRGGCVEDIVEHILDEIDTGGRAGEGSGINGQLCTKEQFLALMMSVARKIVGGDIEYIADSSNPPMNRLGNIVLKALHIVLEDDVLVKMLGVMDDETCEFVKPDMNEFNRLIKVGAQIRTKVRRN